MVDAVGETWILRIQAVPTPEPVRLTFAEVLDTLHSERYTGAVTVHFAQGQPKALDFDRPYRVTVVR